MNKFSDNTTKHATDSEQSEESTNGCSASSAENSAQSKLVKGIRVLSVFTKSDMESYTDRKSITERYITKEALIMLADCVEQDNPEQTLDNFVGYWYRNSPSVTKVNFAKSFMDYVEPLKLWGVPEEASRKFKGKTWKRVLNDQFERYKDHEIQIKHSGRGTLSGVYHPRLMHNRIRRLLAGVAISDGQETAKASEIAFVLVKIMNKLTKFKMSDGASYCLMGKDYFMSEGLKKDYKTFTNRTPTLRKLSLIFNFINDVGILKKEVRKGGGKYLCTKWHYSGWLDELDIFATKEAIIDSTYIIKKTLRDNTHLKKEKRR